MGAPFFKKEESGKRFPQIGKKLVPDGILVLDSAA